MRPSKKTIPRPDRVPTLRVATRIVVPSPGNRRNARARPCEVQPCRSVSLPVVKSLWVIGALGILVGPASIGCAGRIPLPATYRSETAATLRVRMQQARSDVERFVAEARLTYFGEQGRLRGTATVAVVRPMSLRYEVHAPTGALIEAFATDGVGLTWIDAQNQRFVRGQATAEGMDRLLGWAPLRFGPRGWVALLFGEVDVAPSAVLDYDDRAGLFTLTWSESDRAMTVFVDPASARPRRAEVREDSGRLSTLHFVRRGERGHPKKFR